MEADKLKFNRITMAKLLLQDKFLLLATNKLFRMDKKVLRTQIKENAFNKDFIDHLRTLFNVYVKGDPEKEKIYQNLTQIKWKTYRKLLTQEQKKGLPK